MANENETSKLYLESTGTGIRRVWPDYSYNPVSDEETQSVWTPTHVCGVGGTNGFAFTTPQGERFEINTQDWAEGEFTPEGRERLVRAVEEHIGKVGLTIIVV